MALRLIIRFTTSISDLSLTIDRPREMSVVQLKHMIRTKLEAPQNQHRLRLIQGGRLLQDVDILGSVLKVSPAPPRGTVDTKGKGKALELDALPPVFVNCSIGDLLTPALLKSEELQAQNASSRPFPVSSAASPSILTTTTPAPEGFDRLLATGFTGAEIAQLRLQFLSIQSSIHTADSMPSPSTLRRMEDAWIDSNASGTNTSTIARVDGFDFGEDSIGAALDDFLWGNVMGFLWPLGALGWVAGEPGVWSHRRKMAVFTGAMLSVVFGLMRVLG